MYHTFLNKMAYFLRSSLAGRAILSSVKRSSLLDLPSLGPAIRSATRPAIIRTLSSSIPSAKSHSSKNLNQEQLATNMPPYDAKPWSEIPKTKTTLGLNTKLMKNPFKMMEYLQEQNKSLGPVFRLTGTPGMPETVCAMNPEDVESVYRAGDTSYPQGFPFDLWKDARKELNQPLGMFFE